LGRESIEIHGLAHGTYALAIDGVAVGRFSNEQLEHRVELQDIEVTPQHQQATAVASLNQQRNAGPINALRDEWWQFQDFVDARQEANAEPDNAERQAALRNAKAKIRDMSRRVDAANAQAKLLEDRIYELNQPPARKYRLTQQPTPVI
jgi:hypothetical protein